MSVRTSRRDHEVQRITDALRAPLPPARLAADPAALWACGRHARRISTEAKISLVVTAAQVIALVAVLSVLVAFVDWRGVWTASTAALEADPYAGVYVTIATVLVGAAGVVRRTRRTRASSFTPSDAASRPPT